VDSSTRSNGSWRLSPPTNREQLNGRAPSTLRFVGQVRSGDWPRQWTRINRRPSLCPWTSFDHEPAKGKSVFLSHNWADKTFARKLAWDLKTKGCHVWIDEDG
jgi:hypothetical protein